MNTKLILNIDKDIIGEAKKYAKLHNVSLSLIIENYLKRIINDYQDHANVSGSIVDELSGIIKLDKDFDHKEIYGKYLSEKYR